MVIFSLLLTATALIPFAYARPTSYAVWAADSAIARGQGNGLNASGSPLVSYEHGEFQAALQLLYEKTGNKTYYNYIKTGIDNVLSSTGAVGGGYTVSEHQLDPIRIGPTFIYLYKQTGTAKYKAAADEYRNSGINTQPRTAQGQFWHKTRYPNQGWLDGIYMGDIFYAQYTASYDSSNTTAWNDVAAQFTLIYNNTIQLETDANNVGLLYHGYDYSKTAVWASSDRGHSPEVWDRALGWYFMSLVDVLDSVPSSRASTFTTILKSLVPPLVAAADTDSGAWWLVMSQPGRDGNYFESSGTAMFTYALLKALRKGYISDADGSVLAAAKKAYSYMVDNWVSENSDGTFDWLNTVSVGSLSGTGDYAYYISVDTAVNDLKGLSAFLLASIEYEQL